MRVLYKGLQGDDVRSWQNFLIGLDPTSNVVASGVFDDLTIAGTALFQRAVNLNPDGEVGSMTLGQAAQHGFCLASDDRGADAGPNWPSAPVVLPLSLSDKLKLFGQFSYQAAPSASNPEAILITDSWPQQNIVSVTVPQLSARVIGAPSNGVVPIHKLCASQLQAVFAAWEAAGLSDRVLTWAGSWAPRFIRGSRTVLSNHAWGTAFDINVPWNTLGTQGALKGQKGSVRELVSIAYDLGWYWGGWFKGRPDPMHFECFKLVT